MRVLVTGVAGFIGMHVAERLLARGDAVIGIDNLNSYYDPALKEARLKRLIPKSGFDFIRADVSDSAALSSLCSREKPESIVHLAAQAGVRYSLENPAAYVNSNLVGFGNILEVCRQNPVRHLVYASSSSVYGANAKVPFSTGDRTDEPVSLYAATKKANELMAFTYSHLFSIPATGLRFFTVYGPWGRPDMAYFKFTQNILAGRPIEVFNGGQLQRDFTYIDDIVTGVLGTLDRPPVSEGRNPPHRLYNIGNSSPVALGEFISILETVIGSPAIREMQPMQPGDVPATFADVSDLERDVGFRPATPLEDGLRRFFEWYRGYYLFS